MKKTIILLLVLSIYCIIPGGADATNIWEQSYYKPSTGLTLGEWSTVWSGVEGYVIANPFQLNLLYQPGILNSDIDNFNTYLSPDWESNFSDNDNYVFNYKLKGSLPVYTYPDIESINEFNIQWTLSGWHQTILAGDIIELGYNSYLFRVLPYGTYRPFPDDPPVNDVEIFNGNILTEVLGYTYHGNICQLGMGSQLGVSLKPIPEPGTVLLLGIGLLGIGVFSRHRKKKN